ncbi:MAG: hypothetical protein IT567_01220 [Alphaproteobacteria bacterium]|nr:hypothetical protein [Alphaproteobacteria bacterium]
MNQNPAIILGIFGLISGALSGLIPFAPEWIPSVVGGFYIHEKMAAPLLTPVLFSLVLYYGVRRWAGKPFSAFFAVLLFVTVGWLLALNATDWFDTTYHVDGLAGIIGGVIGAGIVMLGVQYLLPDARSARAFGVPVIVGTVAGLLYNPALVVDLPIPSSPLIVLFMLWQASVAAAIGYCCFPKISR